MAAQTAGSAGEWVVGASSSCVNTADEGIGVGSVTVS